MLMLFFGVSVDDGDWSNEKAYVCMWNLDRQNLNPKRPDVIIDVTTPVMCLCFHPLKPSVVAGMDTHLQNQDCFLSLERWITDARFIFYL